MRWALLCCLGGKEGGSRSGRAAAAAAAASEESCDLRGEAQISAVDAQMHMDSRMVCGRKGKEPNLVEDSLFSGSGGSVPESISFCSKRSIHENCFSGYCPRRLL